MKKLIAGLFAAAMLAAGLVTVSGGTNPASAACTPSKYNPSACPQVKPNTPTGVGKTPKTAPKVKAGSVKKIKISFAGKAGTKRPSRSPSVPASVTPRRPGPRASPRSRPSHRGQARLRQAAEADEEGTYKIIVTITPAGGVPTTTVYYIKIV